MAGRHGYADESDEYDADDDDRASGPGESEDPDESDQDDPGDDDAETVPCPYCRKPVHEDAEICPHCGSFISAEDAPRRRPPWIWIGVALCLVPALLLAC